MVSNVTVLVLGTNDDGVFSSHHSPLVVPSVAPRRRNCGTPFVSGPRFHSRSRQSQHNARKESKVEYAYYLDRVEKGKEGESESR